MGIVGTVEYCIEEEENGLVERACARGKANVLYQYHIVSSSAVPMEKLLYCLPIIYSIPSFTSRVSSCPVPTCRLPPTT